MVQQIFFCFFQSHPKHLLISSLPYSWARIIATLAPLLSTLSWFSKRYFFYLSQLCFLWAFLMVSPHILIAAVVIQFVPLSTCVCMPQCNFPWFGSARILLHSKKKTYFCDLVLFLVKTATLVLWCKRQSYKVE